MHLYSGPLSLFARKIEIALGEKGLTYSRTMVPFSQTRGYSPKHDVVIAANPKGQVPVLVDGDLTLYDSTVILEYLEDAYPQVPLYPAGARDRARCRQLELEAGEVLLLPVRKLMFRTEPPGPGIARRDEQEHEARAIEPMIDGNHQALDMKLAGSEFLCRHMTVADIATFMVVHYAVRLGGPPLNRHHDLQAWYDRLGKRPAIAAVVAEIAEADRALSHPVARQV